MSEFVSEDNIQSVMQDDFTFKGKIKISTSLMIKGNMEGVINSKSNIYLEKDSKIKANIDANLIEVKGLLEGNIKTNEYIKLFKASKSKMNLLCLDLIVEKGAVFNGKCTMNRDEDTI